jgi:hypothetical protein
MEANRWQSSRGGRRLEGCRLMRRRQRAAQGIAEREVRFRPCLACYPSVECRPVLVGTQRGDGLLTEMDDAARAGRLWFDESEPAAFVALAPLPLLGAAERWRCAVEIEVGPLQNQQLPLPYPG